MIRAKGKINPAYSAKVFLYSGKCIRYAVIGER